MSDSGCTSVIIFKKGLKTCMATVWGRGRRKCEWKNYRHQGQWRRKERRCSRCQSRDFPAVYGEDYGGADCPLQSMEDQSGADTAQTIHTAAHGGDMWEQAPGRNCWPDSLFWKDFTLWNSPMLEQFLNCSQWEAQLCAVCERLCQCGKDPTLGRGKSMKRKKWQRQSIMTVFHWTVQLYVNMLQVFARILKAFYISHYCLLTEARFCDNYPLTGGLDSLISYPWAYHNKYGIYFFTF